MTLTAAEFKKIKGSRKLKDKKRKLVANIQSIVN